MDFKDCEKCKINKNCPLQIAIKHTRGLLDFANVEIGIKPGSMSCDKVVVHPEAARRAAMILIAAFLREMHGAATIKELSAILGSQLKTIGTA